MMMMTVVVRNIFRTHYVIAQLPIQVANTDVKDGLGAMSVYSRSGRSSRASKPSRSWNASREPSTGRMVEIGRQTLLHTEKRS